MADTDKLVKVGQLDAVADAVIEVVSDTNERLTPVAQTVTDGFSVVAFVQGARAATADISVINARNDRCTNDNVITLKSGEILSVSAITDGYKYAVASTDGFDSGWQTAPHDFEFDNATTLLINVAASNGTDTLTPNDFSLNAEIKGLIYDTVEKVKTLDELVNIGGQSTNVTLEEWALGAINNPKVGAGITFGTQAYYSHGYLNVKESEIYIVTVRLSNITFAYAVGTDENDVITYIWPIFSTSGVHSNVKLTIPSGVSKLYLSSQDNAAPPAAAYFKVAKYTPYTLSVEKSVSKRISDLDKKFAGYKIYTEFEPGSYSLSNGVLSENNASWDLTNCARTKILKVPAYSEFMVTDNTIQGFVYISYDGETYTSYNWVTSTDKKVIPAQDCYVAAYFRAKSGARPTVETIENAFYIQPPFDTANYAELRTNNFELFPEGKTSFFGKFIISGISAAGALVVNTANRILFVDEVSFPVDVTIKIATGYKIGVHTYVDGVHTSDSGWKTGSYLVTAGRSIKIIISREEDQAETDEKWWIDFIKAVTIEPTEKVDGVPNISVNKPFMYSTRPKFMLHRGLQSQAPENSVPAFRLAGQAGAWGIETDVYETSDGHLICIHDDTVDRTTDGTGNVREFTLAEIEALTIDTGTNIGQYPNLKIPTFEEYLAICKTYGCVAFIEIKGVTNLQLLFSTVVKHGLLYQSVFIVWESLLQRVRNVDTDAIVPCLLNGYDTDPSYETVVNTAKNYPNTLVGLQESTKLTDAIIEAAHSNNVGVGIWTINSEASAIGYFGRGIDIVTTNSLTSLTD